MSSHLSIATVCISHARGRAVVACDGGKRREEARRIMWEVSVKRVGRGSETDVQTWRRTEEPRQMPCIAQFCLELAPLATEQPQVFT